jgi:hypothetical protein
LGTLSERVSLIDVTSNSIHQEGQGTHLPDPSRVTTRQCVWSLGEGDSAHLMIASFTMTALEACGSQVNLLPVTNLLSACVVIPI